MQERSPGGSFQVVENTSTTNLMTVQQAVLFKNDHYIKQHIQGKQKL